MRASVEAVVDVYRELGAEVVDVELPNAKYSIAVYYIIATAEASSNLARFDGARYGFRAEDAPELRQMYRKTREEGFGAEVKRRIMLGTYVLSAGYYEAYYGKAQQVRSLLKEDFRKAFESCDAIITPNLADACVFDRGEGRRSARDVSERHLHSHRKPGRHSGNQRSLWPVLKPTAYRVPTARRLLVRADAIQVGPRV